MLFLNKQSNMIRVNTTLKRGHTFHNVKKKKSLPSIRRARSKKKIKYCSVISFFDNFDGLCYYKTAIEQKTENKYRHRNNTIQ